MRKKHRIKLLNEFLLNDIDNFNEYDILDLLLSYAVPMENTENISYKLLNNFGSINKVLDAPITALIEIGGLVQYSAAYIKLLSSVSRLYLENKHIKNDKILSLKELNTKLSIKFLSRMEETVAISLLDATGNLLFDGIVTKNNFNSIDTYIRKIIGLAISYNASSIIIAHNHLNGSTAPTIDDIETVKKLNTIFKNMNIDFLDNIIVSNGKYISFKESGINDAFE